MSSPNIPLAAAWVAPPEFTIVTAEPCRQAWLERLTSLAESDRFGALDLSGVTRIDTAAIQLLVSLGRTLARRGEALQVTGHSDAVSEALAVYGLTTLGTAAP